MAKFGRPFKGKLIITNTYHQNSSNKAVDISAVADTPVYAIGDGAIYKHYTNLGSYCTFVLDGSPIKVFYVHTYRWIPSGKKVKKGEVICYIAPTSLNGGHPTHLHLGLALGYNLMDYMARDNTFAPRDSIVKKAWFNADGSFNWKLHKDLDYKTNKPIVTVPPVITPVIDWEKRSKEQALEIERLKIDLTASKKETKLEKELKEENMEELAELQKKYDTLSVDKNTIENDKNKAIKELNAYKTSRFLWIVDWLEQTFPEKRDKVTP